MRRLAAIFGALLVAAAGLVAHAGADDSHDYTVEVANAFGIVAGSEVRLSGVVSGSVTSLEVSPSKTALIHFNLSGPNSQLGKDTRCTTEPQSLIGDYFVNCRSIGSPLPDGGTIPLRQTRVAIPNDIVQNIIRDPQKEELRNTVVGLGSALAGNGQSVNHALHLAPGALRDLHTVVKVIDEQNHLLGGLAANADRVTAKLAERRADAVRFIRSTADVTEAAAERRADLQRNTAIFDDAAAQLVPTLAQLEKLAREGTPLVHNLDASAPNLRKLAFGLPPFADAGRNALVSLGRISEVGTTAIRHSRRDIHELAESGKLAPATAKLFANLLSDFNDPRRAVEQDARAARDTGRPAPAGYTAAEGFINFLFYLSGTINQFDEVGHLFHVTIFDAFLGPCGRFNTGYTPQGGHVGVPRRGGGMTTSFQDAANCVNWLGPNQPGINEDLHLPPYSRAACPRGAAPQAAEALCSGPLSRARRRDRRSSSLAALAGRVAGRSQAAAGQSGQQAGAGGSTVNDLLDFLFGG